MPVETIRKLISFLARVIHCHVWSFLYKTTTLLLLCFIIVLLGRFPIKLFKEFTILKRVYFNILLVVLFHLLSQKIGKLMLVWISLGGPSRSIIVLLNLFLSCCQFFWRCDCARQIISGRLLLHFIEEGELLFDFASKNHGRSAWRP